MASMSDVAMKFFEACEAGKGWEACKAYCAPDASLFQPGRTAGRCQNPPAIRRLDAGPDEDDARRPL